MSFTGFSDEIDPTKMVANAHFWPGFNLSNFQAAYRLPAEYREEMLVERLKLAIVWANKQLIDFRMEKQAVGATELSNVVVDPDDSPGEEHPLVLLYVRGVSCYAKALLLADYATMMRKSDAQNDSKESEDVADQWYSFAADAINAVQGKLKIHAELL